MNEQDREPIVAIAIFAALADGQATADEKNSIQTALGRLAMLDYEGVAARIASGQLLLADVAKRLSGDDARRLAYETAVIVCHADGAITAPEAKFLDQLRGTLGLTTQSVAEVDNSAASLASAGAAAVTSAASTAGSAGQGSAPIGATSPSGLDELIMQQARLTAACEILPDRQASLAILPLQMRLVYRIGQAYGQQLDMDQVTDLAGTIGIGAAAHMMERVVSSLVRGIGGGLFGGLIGGATGIASGVAVTFSATYALGHVAKQYYAQGRQLSPDDLRALFMRFQVEAKALFPQVQDQVRTQATSLNVPKLLENLR